MHLFHFTEKTGLGGPPFMTFCLLGAKVALEVMFKLYELISILRDPSQTQDIVRFCLGAGGGLRPMEVWESMVRQRKCNNNDKGH